MHDWQLYYVHTIAYWGNWRCSKRMSWSHQQENREYHGLRCFSWKTIGHLDVLDQSCFRMSFGFYIKIIIPNLNYFHYNYYKLFIFWQPATLLTLSEAHFSINYNYVWNLMISYSLHIYSLLLIAPDYAGKINELHLYTTGQYCIPSLCLFICATGYWSHVQG